LDEGARLTLPQGILVAGAIAAVFGAALWMASRSGREGARAFEAFGLARGWAYAKTDTQGLAARMEALIPAERYTFDNVLTAEDAGRKMVLFECGYRRADLQRVRSFGTGCLVESEAFHRLDGTVEVIPRTGIDAALLGGKVALGLPEFDRRFIVLARDAATAKAALSPSVQALLLAHDAGPLFNPVRLVLSKKGAVVLTGYPADPGRWADLIGLAGAIEEAVWAGNSSP
jgi:hypothetical protein